MLTARVLSQLSKRFTSQISRGEYAQLNDADLATFERAIGKKNVLLEDLDPYNTDFMKWYKGSSKCVLTPENAEGVSAILRHCHDRRLAVVPQSGNTGLVGGSVPVFDEVIISTRKIRNFFKLHPSGIVECDAGFILSEIDDLLEPAGYQMPLDLGARGSCYIGGNIATNAGGIRLIRYGSLNANVLKIQAVSHYTGNKNFKVIPDAEGTILTMGAAVRKDNTDLKTYQLLIGSEGALGIITRCAVLVVPKPSSVQTAFLGVESFEKCCAILQAARRDLGEILSSFELMDRESIRSISENTQVHSPLESNPAFNLLIETSGSNESHDSEKMEKFLADCLEKELALDGIQAESGTQTAHLWKMRENASLALNVDGYVYKHDLSLPLEHFYELTEVIRQRLEGTPTKRVVTFGHLGDGNTHLNITSEKFEQTVYDRLYPFLYEWVTNKGGSISAEHGIGRLKRTYHHRFIPNERQRINTAIKRAFDPRAILSPYKMVD